MSSDLVHTQREIDNLINLLADARTESMRLNEYIKRQAMDIILCKSANDMLHEENTRLRAALERIASLDVPRPVGHTFRADGVASKHDKCWHGVTMSDECGVCLSNYARAALDYRKMEGRT